MVIWSSLSFVDKTVSTRGKFTNTAPNIEIQSTGSSFIEELNEKTIGKLFFLLIFETIAIGKMMNVNVYDQPAVEEVKILTREFLNLKKFKK